MLLTADDLSFLFVQDKIAAPTRLMALRLFVNAFKSADTRTLVAQNCGKVLS